MKLRLVVSGVLLLSLLVCGGCPPRVSKVEEDLLWQRVTFDSPDYFYDEFFEPFDPSVYSKSQAKKRSAEAKQTMTDNIASFRKNGLLGPHRLVFNPLVSKGQKTDLSGSFSGSVGGLSRGYVSGRIDGKSRPATSYVFCWSLPAQEGRKAKSFISTLPCDRVVLLQEQGESSVRFKYNIGELSDRASWVFEAPGILINEDNILYATISISRSQLAEGYLGMR